MIHLVTTSDENFFEALITMVASALVALDKRERVTLHVLDGGITPASQKRLTKICDSLHPSCALRFLPVDASVFSTWKPANGNFLTYARIMIGSLIEEDKVLFLDADMIVLKDLSLLWHTDMQSKTVLAAPDLITHLGDDCPWVLTPEEKEYCYFNAGVMLIDLQQWRNNGIEEKVCRLASAPTVLRCFDQTLLNYVLRQEVGFIDPSWNWQHSDVIVEGQLLDGIYHFTTGKKPWRYFDRSLRFRIWRMYYSAFVGNTLELFLTRTTWRGLVAGNTEVVIRSHPLARKIYLRWLTHKIERLSDPQQIAHLSSTVHYYTTGRGGPAADAAKPLEHRIAKSIKGRLRDLKSKSPA